MIYIYCNIYYMYIYCNIYYICILQYILYIYIATTTYQLYLSAHTVACSCLTLSVRAWRLVGPEGSRKRRRKR